MSPDVRQRLARVASMDGAEVGFRLRTLVRTTGQRVRVRLGGSAWRREALLAALVAHPPDEHPTPALYANARRALEQGQWLDAHEWLCQHFHGRTPPFILAPASRAFIRSEVPRHFPGAAEDAARVADRLVRGRYDLLGYRALDFGTPPDWHADPVHRTRSPRLFWRDVPFLDAGLGDHKIIWELNRHQHWLALGRAYWLTGNETARARVIEELGGWMAANPPLMGINWASMLELAFRCLSWTWALHFFVEPPPSTTRPATSVSAPLADAAPWTVDLLLGLDRQLAHIEQNLSHYFSPNTHLLGEALALYVCGYAFPELAASSRRVARGRRLLLEGLKEQVESDGGHRERSTHYHRYTLDFYLLALAVARLNDDPAAVPLASGSERLAAAARLLADSRGYLPHIGDDDGGMLLPMCGRPPDAIADSLSVSAALTGQSRLAIGPPPEEAWWWLSHPALQPTLLHATRERAADLAMSGALATTGYFVSRTASGDHAVIDAGPHGYLNGGHAHADALACTFTVAGQPLLVDPGTASYTADRRLRDRFRTTAAHNTVVVDGRSQSIPRGPFHWSHVANGRAVRWQTSTYFDYFEGLHDGYAPLTHRRHVLALHDDLFVVIDALTGDVERRHRAEAHWHVHPSWQLSVTPARATAAAGARTVQFAWDADTAEQLTADETSGLGWFSPMYGHVEPLTTLRLSRTATLPLWICTVIGLDRVNPVTRVERIAVRLRLASVEPAAAAPGAAFRIHREGSIDDVIVTARTPNPTSWQADGYESDARLLFCRHQGGLPTRLVIVDSERVRIAGTEPIEVAAPQPVRGMHFVFGGSGADRGAGRRRQARVSGGTLGVELRMGGQLLALAQERRAHVRTALGVR